MDIGQFETIFRYGSPFLATAMTAGVTYLVVGRQKRVDVLTTERLAAFKGVQASLISLKRYCEAAEGEHIGGDFAPRLEGLPQDVPRSALTQTDQLRATIDRSLIFFPRDVREGLDELLQNIYLLASMELATADEPKLAEVAAYRRAIEKADKCIDQLYATLRLPS